MTDTSSSAPDAAARGLRLLRRLVTLLTITMILAMATLIWVFLTRFPDLDRVALPEAIALPDGTRPTAFTRGPDWVAVVAETDAGEAILIYDAATGEVRQTVDITP